MRYGLSEKIINLISEIVKKHDEYNFKIFGSRARNDYKKTSDIDIAVFGDVTPKDKFNILNEFDLLNIIYTVDIVFYNELENENLKKSIQKDGKDL